MPDSPIPPRLDPVPLAFPTDAITIGAIRRNEPGLLDLRAHPGHVAANEAFSAHELELVLAERAFAAACGAPDPHPTENRSEIVSILSDVYVTFGIASGSKAAKELIRHLEQAAAKQAEPFRQGGPPHRA